MDPSIVVAIVAGFLAIVAGVGSGLLGAWFAPFATQRAEETRLKIAAKRDVVAQGRALVADFINRQADETMSSDPRYLRIHTYLSPSVRHFYSDEGRRERRALLSKTDPDKPPQWEELAVNEYSHGYLIEDLNRLEQEWNLI